MTTPQAFGQALPNQVDRIVALSDAQLELLADVRDLFRDRIALEREYATKLQTLARKAVDKKNKKIGALIVGLDSVKPADESTIKQSTLDKAYSQLISSFAETAQDHVHLADELQLRVAEVLKATEKRHEEARKRQAQYYQKLLSDYDKVQSDCQKNKQKYDAECSEVAIYSQKQERSSDDKHAERVAKQLEQQRVDMYNSKNVYLVSTSMVNKMKSKLYTEDLPALEDQLQTLQTQLLDKFSKIVIEAESVHSRHLEILKSRLDAADAAARGVDSQRDQQLFIEHNIRQFTYPPDLEFQSCPTYYDTNEINVDPAPKVYLQNKLAKCKEKLLELQPIVEAKQRDVTQLGKLVDTYSDNQTLESLDEVSDSYLDAHHQLSFYLSSERMLSTEIETISVALGGDEGEQHPHSFKSSSFSIPTQCAYCKSSIWGLSKQGKSCQDCGISVHSKCELKVPADCAGDQGKQRHAHSLSVSSTLSRSASRGSATPPVVIPTPSSFQVTTTDQKSTIDESHSIARVLFDFTPTSPFELAVTEGSFVHVLEEDDGSGWVKVLDNSGKKGLVPASYVDLQGPAPSIRESTPQGSEVLQAVGEFVRAVYDYEAQGPGELGLQEGQLIRLTDGASGGRNYADGWWEGVGEAGKQGIFPSNYPTCEFRRTAIIVHVAVFSNVDFAVEPPPTTSDYCLV
ncbi:hypothetical protein BDY19DRAFT_1043519 [Irpex rosettiformis]|uniref:Uncharacterized protein n=1 Tax=Irpex rosettiformis TaxID=378272 RepID=A0ACB8TRY8_9APHY|nr:hypothetical protein BDY19DRAFT_1043519 [Irpex rosettiformis]